jgi:hypothetical protein
MAKTDKVEFDLYESPDGIEYSLDDWGRTFLMSQSGQGFAPIEYRTSRGPFQHGETALDYVLRPRVLQYVFRLQTRNRDKYWVERERIQNVFRPNRQATADLLPGKLKKILEDGTQRALDVFVDQGLDFASNSGNWDEFGSDEVIRFIAYNPIWYDPNQSSQIFALADLAHLVFPITFAIQFGSKIINDSAVVAYTGTWLELPVITITGPIQTPIIQNSSTGEKLELTYNVPAGVTITIDLRYGKKTVVDNLGNNLVGVLTADSDLATFHLAPDPEVAGGNNTVFVNGTGAEPNQTSINIYYYLRYGAI